MKRRGFTLIELVIVIVILGILAAVAIPKFVDLTGEARKAACKGALGGLRSGIAIWYAHNAATGTGTAWPALDNLTNTANATPVMAQGVPANPFVTGAASISVVTTNAKPGSTNDGQAWVYDTQSGQIWASYGGTNTDALDW
ncbi:MAG: type II secretion system protein [Candidatus Omnitrophica bacterium]|nr:type II secretion system protein [Candidatus Omnitrophota bacterium]